MEIRKAGKSEIEKLVQVRLDFFKTFSPGWQATASEDEVDEVKESLRNYYEKHLNNNVEAIIAEENGKIVACAILTVFQKSPAPSTPKGLIGEVGNVLTYPEYRRLGLATGVMKKLIEEGRKMGVERIDLQASDEGQKIYEKLGFKKMEGHTSMRIILTTEPN